MGDAWRLSQNFQKRAPRKMCRIPKQFPAWIVSRESPSKTALGLVLPQPPCVALVPSPTYGLRGDSGVLHPTTAEKASGTTLPAHGRRQPEGHGTEKGGAGRTAVACASVQPLAVVRAGYSTRDFTEVKFALRFFVARVPLLWLPYRSPPSRPHPMTTDTQCRDARAFTHKVVHNSQCFPGAPQRRGFRQIQQRALAPPRASEDPP